MLRGAHLNPDAYDSLPNQELITERAFHRIADTLMESHGDDGTDWLVFGGCTARVSR